MESEEAKSMGNSSLKLQCWPGLASLWHRGDLPSMLQAGAFSLLLNTFLLTSFLWPGLLGAPLRWTVGASVLVWWLIGVRSNRSFLFQSLEMKRCSSPELTEQFIEAQCQYLRGHWTEAESILRQIYRKNPRDVEAGLLLSQVWRRSGQPMKALEQLGHLQKLDEALQWMAEIGREVKALEVDLLEAEDSEAEDRLGEDDEVRAVTEAIADTSETEVGSTAFSSHDDPLRHAA